ncbi:dihydroneopterin triphosphate diphosphatase [Limnobacter sp.]|uniref:dihydroneopterin triphosphate diphosphatase n=1 Tax=Limnobacter sp. TaxID=2003368 RepID=UPI003518D653
MSGDKIPVSVLVVMYSADGDFLLIERADRAGYWQSVTGSLDWAEEPPLQAAARELLEETGLQAQPCEAPPVLGCSVEQLCEPMRLRPWPHQLQYEIFSHWRHRYPPGVTHNTEHWFAVCLPSGTLPNLSAKEHVAYAWLGAEEAAARCFSPNNAQAILALAKRLIKK